MYLNMPTNLSTVSFLKLPLSLSLFIIHEQCSIHMSLQISSLLFLYASYPGLDTKRFVCVFFCTESAQLCKIMFNTETECIISLYQHNCFTYFILAYIQWLIMHHTSFLCVLSTYLLRKCMHVVEMPVKEHIIWKATHSKHISWQTFDESVDSHLPNV